MSYGIRMVDEVGFAVNGHQVVAFLPFGRRGEGLSLPQLSARRWLVQVDDMPAFFGPEYRGYLRGEEALAEEELRDFIEEHPTLIGLA